MRYLRTFAFCLLSIFLIDTVSASTVLHLPSEGSMQQGHAVEVQSAGTQAEDAHHGQHAVQHEKQHAGHGKSSSDCGSCHDCLFCFSVLLPLNQLNTAARPYTPQDDTVAVIYFSPALALLQRPPISS